MKKNVFSKNYDTCICLYLKDIGLKSLLHSETMSVFQQNGVEVVVLIEEDKNVKQEISEIVGDYPLVNWRFISFSEGKLIAACKKAVELSRKLYFYFTCDVLISLTRFNDIKQLNKNHKATVVEKDDSGNIVSLFCNSDKLHIENVDEATITEIFKTLAFELHSAGIKEVTISNDSNVFFSHPTAPLIKNSKDIVGESGSLQVHYDYLRKENGRDLLKKFLNNFSAYELLENIKVDEFKIIALVQTFNEIKNINNLLKHLDSFCDGIILLDDGSTDGTFEEAKHEKLLLKVKKVRTEFNDLENRNMLLDLVSFFNHQWAFYIDADERFDLRFGHLYDYIKDDKYDVIAFHLINLWNSDLEYRTDLEDSNQFSKEGILVRWRMFRNIGRCQIFSEHNLHFPTVPYFKNMAKVPMLIKHYGMLEEDLRIKKYNFYLSQDKNFQAHSGRNYELLNNLNSETRLVSSITLDWLQ